MHWVVVADKIPIFSKGKQNRGSWSYRLGASGKPATLDLTPRGGPTMPATFRVEGDLLTVLLQTIPKNGRPKDFGDRSGPRVGPHVRVRVRSGGVE